MVSQVGAARGDRGEARETKLIINSQVLEPGGRTCHAGHMERHQGGQEQKTGGAESSGHGLSWDF